MTNTQRYYGIMVNHRKFLKQLTDDYEEALQKLEPYRGSEGYSKALEELEKTKREELTKARAAANDELKKTLDAMEATWNNRPLTPPSSDQVNLLSLLRNMKRISPDQFKQAMNTCRGCRIAEEALAELARDRGELMPLARQMDGVRVKESIDALRRGADHFINRAHSLSDGTRRELLNGPGGNRAKSDPLLWLMLSENAISSKSECLRCFGRVTDSAAFCAAVDGE